MIDVHSHILPGVDDGADDMSEALNIAREAKKQGLTALIATPHILADSYKLKPKQIDEKVDELQKVIRREGIDVKIYSGAEIFATPDIGRRAENNELKTINNGEYLLIEFPFRIRPSYIDNIFYDLKVLGLKPVICHPERYYWVMEDYDILYKWAEEGIPLQLNSGSLLGSYGSQVKKTAEMMILCNLVHLLGSDVHSMQRRKLSFQKGFERVKEISKAAADIVITNNKRIVENKELEKLKPQEFKKQHGGFLKFIKNKIFSSTLFLFFLFFIFFSKGVSAETFSYDDNYKMNIDINNTINIYDYNLNTEISYDDNRINLDQFYFETDIFNGKLSFGRQFIRLGPGYFSQLMLSDKNTSLDAVVHQGQFNIEKIKNDYMMMIAFLGEGSNKQLFAQRISNDSFVDGLELGISESVMVSQKINTAYYLPVPFFPYYLRAYITGLDSEYNLHDDKYLGLDFSYEFKNDLLVYGELLVDEFPQTVEAGNPDKRGHLLGLYYPVDFKTEFFAEYSNVFNYVYIHRFVENRYTYQDQYLGHWLGHDADVMDMQLSRKLDDKSRVKIGLRFIRRGIGDMQTDYGADHQDKKFLSSITEENIILRSNYTRDINKNMNFEIDTELGKAYFPEGKEENIVNLNCNFAIKF